MLRLNRRHFKVDHWQFDEFVSQAATAREPDRDRYLDLLSGIFYGLYHGRAELEDEPEQGIVWAAGAAIRALPSLSVSAGALGMSAGTPIVLLTNGDTEPLGRSRGAICSDLQ